MPEGLTSIGESAFNYWSGLKEIIVIIASEDVYNSATSTSACGNLLRYVTTVKVLTSLVKENHAYINSDNFPNVTTEGDYTVYKK